MTYGYGSSTGSASLPTFRIWWTFFSTLGTKSSPQSDLMDVWGLELNYDGASLCLSLV
jgi:hypothetical protein